jgi:hypothetical protein
MFNTSTFFCVISIIFCIAMFLLSEALW